MSKPWLEQWGYIAAGAQIGGELISAEHSRLVRHAEKNEPGIWADLVDAKRLAHASAAPDMCRALLVVEWFPFPDGDACPHCDAPLFMPEGYGMPATRGAHNPDCASDTALTKAGLPDQESRDAARKEMWI